MSKQKRARRLIGKILIEEERRSLVYDVQFERGELRLCLLQQRKLAHAQKPAFFRQSVKYSDRIHPNLPRTEEEWSGDELRQLLQDFEAQAERARLLETMSFLGSLVKGLSEGFELHPYSGEIVVRSEEFRAFGRGLYESFPKDTHTALFSPQFMPPVSVMHWLARVHAVQISNRRGNEPPLPF